MGILADCISPADDDGCVHLDALLEVVNADPRAKMTFDSEQSLVKFLKATKVPLGIWKKWCVRSANMAPHVKLATPIVKNRLNRARAVVRSPEGLLPEDVRLGQEELLRTMAFHATKWHELNAKLPEDVRLASSPPSASSSDSAGEAGSVVEQQRALPQAHDRHRAPRGRRQLRQRRRALPPLLPPQGRHQARHDRRLARSGQTRALLRRQSHPDILPWRHAQGEGARRHRLNSELILTRAQWTRATPARSASLRKNRWRQI